MELTHTKNNEVAVVTGACSDIGQAIIETLINNDVKVVASDLDINKLNQLLNDNEQRKPLLRIFPTDLSHEENALSLMNYAVEEFEKIDILINNAGGGIILPFLEHTPSTLRQTIDRNLWTTIWCDWAVLPIMKKQQYGRIIHIGADSVRNGLANHAGYNAAKGGVHGITTGLAREFAKDNITINTVAPCAVQTKILDEFVLKQPDTAQKFLDVIPMGRAAHTREIASIVSYLTSIDAAFITGQVISINGGSTML